MYYCFCLLVLDGSWHENGKSDFLGEPSGWTFLSFSTVTLSPVITGTGFFKGGLEVVLSELSSPVILSVVPDNGIRVVVLSVTAVALSVTIALAFIEISGLVKKTETTSKGMTRNAACFAVFFTSPPFSLVY